MSKLIKSLPPLLLALVLASLIAIIPALGEIAVTDSLGRTVTIPTEPRRVVSLSPAITEALALLGVLDRVVAADSISLSGVWYLNASEALRSRNVSDVGGYWYTSIVFEEILKARPDLVIADKGAHAPLLEQFEENGINVIYLNGGSSKTVEDVLWDIELLAKIFGKEETYAKFRDEALSKFGEVREWVASAFPNATLKLVVVVGISNGIWVAGNDTYISDILGKLGILNAIDKPGWQLIGLEEIAKAKPDGIVLLQMGFNETDVESVGLKSLGIPLIYVSDQKLIDVLSKPGPLIAFAPDAIKSIILMGIPPRTSATTAPGAQGSAGPGDRSAELLIAVFAVSILVVSAILVTLGISWRRKESVKGAAALYLLVISLFSFSIYEIWTAGSDLILRYRIYRLASAILTGFVLGFAGSAFQSILRNPLADHYVLGIGAGALTATYLSLLIFGPAISVALVSAIAGGLLALALTLLIAESTGGTFISYTLSGLGVNALLSGAALLLTYVIATKYPYAVVMLAGSFIIVNTPRLLGVIALAAFVLLCYFILAKPLNALSVNDEMAISTGYDPRFYRAISSILMGAAASVAVGLFGLMGFVGLASPHISRLLLKTADNRAVMPSSGIISASILYYADLASRHLLSKAVGEVPAGVIASLVGAPFFLIVYYKRFRRA